MLRQSIAEVRSSHPFDIVAWVLLPDHLHCIWRLPEGDADYSGRWSAIKRASTRALRMESKDRTPHRDGRLWQRRFWEHTIRSERDLMLHVDYIHWNPVRHGVASEVDAWRF